MRRWSLRTRLLAAFLALSLLPGIGLTLVLTRTLPWSFDRWASPGVRLTFENAVAVARNTLARIENDLRQRWVLSQDVPELAAWREAVQRTLTVPGAPPLANRFVHLGPLVGAQFNLDFMQVLPDPPDSAWTPRATLTRDPLVAAPGRLRLWSPGNLDEGLYLKGDAGELAFVRRARFGPGSSQLVAVGIYLEPEFYTRLADLGTAVERHELLRASANLNKAAVYVGAAFFTLLLALVSVVVADRLSRSLSRPVEDLAAGLDRVAAGEFSTRVEPAGSPELQALIASFNRMTVDLAESKAELARAARVAAWQDAARRIAHEIRNPLQPIALALHRIEKTVADDPERRERVRDAVAAILAEVEALKRLSAGFAEFARMPDPAPESVDLVELVRGALELVSFPGVRVEFEACPESVPVRVDRGQIRQVLTNLVKNAAEAMPSGGTVRLVVGTRRGAGAGQASLEVHDEGPGVPEAERERLFQPYFTTKAEGTGLGLPIVQGIVTAHGGRIEVEAGQSGGALFRVLLPLEPRPLPGHSPRVETVRPPMAPERP